jgi:hypothetical protein
MSLNSPYIHPNSTDLAPSRPRVYFPLKIKKTRQGYDGLFTDADIPHGSTIGHDGGIVVTSVEDVPPELRYAVLIDDTNFLAPRDFKVMEEFWYLNHSCDPNVARIGGLVFIAKKTIRAGEELTLDYAPLIAGVKNWEMTCSCGTPHCRKKITGEDWKVSKIREELWLEWLPHIQQRKA